jgi:hypothetical protein
VGIQRFRALYDANGPFLSLYLRTPGDVEDAARELDTRWRDTRRDLGADGVPEDLLEAIDPLVDRAYERGPGLAVIASADGVLLTDAVPEPAREAVVAYGPLPSIVPLLAQEQQRLPNVAVLTDRTGAEIVTRVPDGERVETVEGTVSPQLHRSAPGGWSQPRYQRRAERLWQANATEVAEALTRVVDEVRPRVVTVSGDVRAVQLLADQVPERVSTVLERAGGEFPDVEPVLRRTDEAVRELVREDDAALLDRFAAARGQRDRAADGPDAVLVALAKAQVETLLMTVPTADGPGRGRRTAWFGEEPPEVALDEATLDAMGVGFPVEAPLDDVLVRGAMGTGATPRILAAAPDGPADGVGGLLRWADPDVRG